MPRVKCSVLDRNHEKAFSRIATRYVISIQLYLEKLETNILNRFFFKRCRQVL